MSWPSAQDHYIELIQKRRNDPASVTPAEWRQVADELADERPRGVGILSLAASTRRKATSGTFAMRVRSLRHGPMVISTPALGNAAVLREQRTPGANTLRTTCHQLAVDVGAPGSYPNTFYGSILAAGSSCSMLAVSNSTSQEEPS